MLEGDPIELAKMILALGDLLQRTLLGRAELEVGSGFHIRRSIRACARRQCGAVAQRHAVARGKGEKPLCPRIFLRAACNQSWPRLDPGIIMTVTVGQQGHLGHREGVIRDASIVVYGLLMPVLDAILAVDANGRLMVIPHEPAPQSVARCLSEKQEKATVPGMVKSVLQREPESRK